MSDLSMQLPERLSRLGETGLLIPLLRLLADGDPVTVQQLSVAGSAALAASAPSRAKRWATSAAVQALPGTAQWPNKAKTPARSAAVRRR